MAHFAEIDENGQVLRVIVASYEFIASGAVGKPYRWLICDEQRKNYPGPGWRYDEIRDAFVPPRPSRYFELNEETCLWEPPFPAPEDGKEYSWSDKVGWKELPAPELCVYLDQAEMLSETVLTEETVQAKTEEFEQVQLNAIKI